MPRARVTVMADTDQQYPSGCPGEALTCIRECIHCVATQDTDGNHETDTIEIDNFLDALAEIAMSIATRKEEKSE